MSTQTQAATKRTSRLNRAKSLSKALAGQGQCSGLAQLWRDAEAAPDPDTDVATQLALSLCTDCPLVATCRRWAVADRYTGIAAGTHWTNGQEDER